MIQNNIFISTSSFAEYDKKPMEMLTQANLTANLNPLKRKLTTDELIEYGKNAIGIIAGTEEISHQAMQTMSGLRVISRCGAGIDNVDVIAAQKLGIRVHSTPWGPTRAVAELTLGLILDCLRGISQSDRSIRTGGWHKPMGWLLEGKTVGIIGFGRIGKEVARLIKPLGAMVIAYDTATPDDNLGVKITTLDNLIANSDIISLHVPGEAGCLIDFSTINSMKDGAIIVNASRGGLIDENALYEALITNKLASAAIDTPSQEPYSGKLCQLDNVVITPHIGSYARESRTLMEIQAVENLISALN